MRQLFSWGGGKKGSTLFSDNRMAFVRRKGCCFIVMECDYLWSAGLGPLALVAAGLEMLSRMSVSAWMFFMR